jgi:hypothetical protein
MTQQQDDLQGREPPMAVVEGVKKERSSSAGHGRRATGDGRRANQDILASYQQRPDICALEVAKAERRFGASGSPRLGTNLLSTQTDG